MTATVYFDDEIRRTKSGRVVPFYDFVIVEDAIKDLELVWFHVGYGKMQLYRLHQIDDTNDFIAEDLHKRCWKFEEEWEYYSKTPSAALETI